MIGPFFKIVFADGSVACTYETFKSYAEAAVAGTGSSVLEVSEEEAKRINLFYNANGGEGYKLLRIDALEAALKTKEATG